MNRKFFSAVVTLLTAMSVSGCSLPWSSSEPEVVKMSSLRQPDPRLKTVEVRVSREKLRSAVTDKASFQRLRVVQTYRRNEEFFRLTPEYRLFECEPSSACGLVGLRSGDVVVAADDYVITASEKFRGYLSLLPSLNEGSIEIRRGDQMLLLHCTIS